MRVFFLCAFFFLIRIISAVNPPNNAIALSTGGACVTQTNAFAIENNLGAMGFTESTVSLSAGNLYGLADYSNLQVAGVWQQDFATLGISYKSTPFHSFTEQKIQVGIAKKLVEGLSLGVSLDYLNWQSRDAYYSPLNILSGSLGLLYKVNEDLSVGFTALNPMQSRYTKAYFESYPAQYRFGLSYVIAPDIKSYIDFLQVSGENLNLQAGAELTKEKYRIRAGLDLRSIIAFGLGYRANKVEFAASVSHHNQLGLSPSLLLSYAF